jgi:hypothetical protein
LGHERDCAALLSADLEPKYAQAVARDNARCRVVGTTVEVRSAISRLHGEGVLTAKGQQHALARLEVLRQEWREMMPSDRARSLAEGLPDAYGLRALDSFQLAAALVWCNEKPKNRVFVCDDSKLSVAAQIVGFTVVP